MTAARLAVLEVVAGRPHDTESVFDAVRAILPDVSRQVYDVLAALTTAGLIRRIQPSGSVAPTKPGWGTTTTTSCAAPAAPIADIDCATGEKRPA